MEGTGAAGSGVGLNAMATTSSPGFDRHGSCSDPTYVRRHLPIAVAAAGAVGKGPYRPPAIRGTCAESAGCLRGACNYGPWRA